MDAMNVKLADRIKSNKEKFDIEDEKLNVLKEEFVEHRKKVKALKDMDERQEFDVTKAKIAELEVEYNRFVKELGIIIGRQKVLAEEWAELWNEMMTGDGDGE